MNDEELAILYAEFADEDRRLAAEGIADYEVVLVGEDAQ
jgi:hypothetical protein